MVEGLNDSWASICSSLRDLARKEEIVYKRGLRFDGVSKQSMRP